MLQVKKWGRGFSPGRRLVSFGAAYQKAPQTGGGQQRIKSYHLNGVGRLSFVESCTDTGFTIRSDVPKVMGGGNSAPQPVELLLAALVGCKQATAMFVARHMKPRMKISQIEFDVSASRDESGSLSLPLGGPERVPSRLECVNGTAWVTTEATQQQVDLLSREVEKRCPVANMVMLSGCKLQINWRKKILANS